MNIKMKKLLILNIPYLFIALAFTKLSQAWRYSTGYEAAEKILHLSDGFAVAFNSPLPSFHPQDLIFGILLAAAIRLAVYLKSRNAKKYRKGENMVLQDGEKPRTFALLPTPYSKTM